MNNILADNFYVQDIHQQPQALRATLSAFRQRSFDDIRQLAQQLSHGNLRRVVLTGMGSSYHGLHPLRLRLLSYGLCVHMIETSELIHFAASILTPDSLVIVASQSGQSIEILQLLDLVGERMPILAITNTSDSPLAHAARVLLLTHAGNEYSVSCKTYLTTLAALAILGDLLTMCEPDQSLYELDASVDAIQHYLSQWDSHLETAIQSVANIRQLVLVGRGPSLAAAGTGGLITKEASHIMAEGMSSAAFRHGPFEMVSSALLVLVFAGTGPTRQMNTKLAADIRKAGGRAEIISSGMANDPYTFPRIPESGIALLEILPVQMLTVALALRNNHVPGTFELGSKITTVE